MLYSVISTLLLTQAITYSASRDGSPRHQMWSYPSTHILEREVLGVSSACNSLFFPFYSLPPYLQAPGNSHSALVGWSNFSREMRCEVTGEPHTGYDHGSLVISLCSHHSSISCITSLSLPNHNVGFLSSFAPNSLFSCNPNM